MNESSDRGDPEMQRAAERYLREGLRVIPVPAGEKNPNRRNWQEERWTVEDVPRLWTNGQGIGALWGTPSDGFVDVDLDWRESRVAARYILSPTKAFGRPGAPESHRVYRTMNTIPRTKRYKVPGDGPDRSVAELLSTGTQSLLPPSIHHTGERREWEQPRPATHIDGVELEEAVADVATAALLARNWPGQGARHDYALAAAGYIGRNLPRDRAERIMEAAIAASGDEEGRGRLRDVRDTLDNLAAGQPTTGGPTLDTLAPGVVDQLRRWHGWNERVAERARPSAELRRTLTDLGNAERFVDEHGDDVRFCSPWGKWLVTDGKRWVPDDTGKVERRMKATVRGIYAEAARAESERKRKALADHAKRSEATKRITDALRLARSEPEIPVLPGQLDSDPWLLNCENGTIDLRTGELREHRRGDLLTKIAPVEYDPDAAAPTFERFLERILPSEALRRFMRRAIGYAAAGVVSEEMLVILHGTGANGKSTLVNAVMDSLGHYAMQVAPDLLLAKRGSHPTELADLFGARLAAAVEVDQDRRLAESLVKQLTGRDRIKARRMREDFWEFDPTHTIFLATNHRPDVRGTDHAIWRRLKLVPFEITIPEAEQDKRLAAKLHEERAGILAWIVRGCLEYQDKGLGEPEEVRAATEGYRVEMDVLAAFIEDRCVEHPRASVGATPLYNAYKDWCEESGETKLTQTKFGRRLKERGFRSEKSQRVTWYGLGLRNDRPDPDGGPGSEPRRGAGAVDSSGSSKGAATPSDSPENSPNRLNVDSSEQKRLSGESSLDKPDSADLPRGLRQSRPEISITSKKPPHESAMPEKGLKPSNCLKPSDEAGATPRGEVSEILATPPAWLTAQLDRCREDPERLLNPTATAIANALYNSPARWREVLPVLEEHLGGGAPAA